MPHSSVSSRGIALRAALLLVFAGVIAGCGPASSMPSSPTPTAAPATTPQPTPPAPRVGQAERVPAARLSGVITEMTADGLVPLEDVELYCDACGEFGHTFTSTNASGAYDFGREGIWMFPGSLATTILIHKDGYFDPASVSARSAGASEPSRSTETRDSTSDSSGSSLYGFLLARSNRDVSM